MKIEQIKVGQKVRITKRNLDKNNEGVNGVYWCSSMDEFRGNIFTVLKIEGKKVRFKEGICYYYFDPDWLDPVEKDWDSIEVDDEIEDYKGDKRKVLGVCDKIVFVSSLHDKIVTGLYQTKEFFARENYKIVQPTEQTKREVSMKEVCDKFGEDVVIKKEE